MVEDTKESIRRPPSQSCTSHHMKLRSQATRPALGQVTGNACHRKRKASVGMADAANTKPGKKAVMDKNAGAAGRHRGSGRPARDFEYQSDEDEPSKQPAPRRPGRPRKIPLLADLRGLDLQLRPSIPDTVWAPSRSTSPSKATSSPSKKGQIPLDKPISEAAIDMQYLRLCNPAVYLTNFSSLRIKLQEVSSPVRELFEKLNRVPPGPVPSALQSMYEKDANTPRKSKELLPKSDYLEAGQTPFPQHCLARMKSTADDVLDKALRAHALNAHERQWGAIVNQLLCEVEIWQERPKQIVVLNIETCSIQPSEIRPMRPDGQLSIDCDAQTVGSNTAPENMGRMVDWCLAMDVCDSDMKVIEKVFASLQNNVASLNQSLSYIRQNPLILDIEIKKTLQPRDPQVQLAIWASSALLKKRLHRWDTSMPMPALAINGHVWDYYIFFEMNNDLMMAGPYPFGTTVDLNGIWTIFYRLHIIMKWGMTEYSDWFQEHMMKTARRFLELKAELNRAE